MFNYIISPDYITVLIWQQIMKRLIKRYVLKAQVDKENDEVNEGKKETAIFRGNFFHVVLGTSITVMHGGFEWKEGLFLFYMHWSSDSNGNMPMSSRKMEK